MVDERDAEDAIHKLDGTEFGYKRRRLSVEWSKVRAKMSVDYAGLDIQFKAGLC
jgi:hypothetical protein